MWNQLFSLLWAMHLPTEWLILFVVIIKIFFSLCNKIKWQSLNCTNSSNNIYLITMETWKKKQKNTTKIHTPHLLSFTGTKNNFPIWSMVDNLKNPLVRRKMIFSFFIHFLNFVFENNRNFCVSRHFFFVVFNCKLFWYVFFL